jgi:hypothetical protein
MAEIRLQIPDEVVDKLRSKLGDVKVTDIARDAISLYNWAVEERAKGNYVLSSDATGEQMTRLAMPSLDRAAASSSKGQ